MVLKKNSKEYITNIDFLYPSSFPILTPQQSAENDELYPIIIPSIISKAYHQTPAVINSFRIPKLCAAASNRHSTWHASHHEQYSIRRPEIGLYQATAFERVQRRSQLHQVPMTLLHLSPAAQVHEILYQDNCQAATMAIDLRRAAAGSQHARYA